MQSLEWVRSESIMGEHKRFPVKQIYLWLLTTDNKIPIVLGNNGYQLPGGKPEGEESYLETTQREMQEETGIDISIFDKHPQLFGYYLSQNDPNWPGIPIYLKLRFYLFADEESKNIKIYTNEKEAEKDKMTGVKFGDIFNLSDDISWVKDAEEYLSFLKIIKDSRRI